jgi:hypothetical protein
MKKYSKIALLLLLVTAGSAASAAPRDHDYHWVVETHTQGETYTVFRIYDQETHLVYEEKIMGRELDIRKKSVRRKFDKGLAMYVQSVEQLAQVNRQSLLKSFAFR